MTRLATLLAILLAIPCPAATRSADDVEEARRAFRHADAIATLRAAIDAGDNASAARLAELSLEAALVARLGDALPGNARSVIEDLAALELEAFEAVALARLAFFHGEQAAGEAALGRARDLDPETKAGTDRMLAEARGEVAPEGGYFRYRGQWMALARRDRERMFDLALEALWEVHPDREAFRLEPSAEVPNLGQFREQWKGAGPSFLRRHAASVRALLVDDYAIVRSWLTSYDALPARERLLETAEVMREPREEALKLISTYGKSQQRQVDDNRRQLEESYAVHSQLLVRDWRKVDALDPADAYELRERTRAREQALGDVHRYLAAYEGGGLAPAVISPSTDSATTKAHVLPGREQSGLEDVLWLVLNHAADQHLDVMARCAEIQRNAESLTPWERLIVGHVRLRSIVAYNELVATSLNSSERECCTALDDYRIVLGLEPLEIEERLVAASRKHSQEMLDLGYFGHISPIARNRGPTDRVRLEGFAGGVGENCYAGGGSGRGAFEAWYHSPGHHRNLVSGGPQIGVGVGVGGTMWTMVVGGGDFSWRTLHQDLPPERRTALLEKVEELTERIVEGRPSDSQREAVAAELPDVLPMLANQGFAAAGAGRSPSARAAPDLLGLIVEVGVPVGWRALQVAAVAALIDVMDVGVATAARQTSFDLVAPLLESPHGYQPDGSRTDRRDAVNALRKEWEDAAQLRYRPEGIAKVEPRPEIPGRAGDGQSKRTALRALTTKERKRLAKRHGGGTETEEAVEAGLAWLASVQDEDGAWRAQSFALHADLEGVDAGALGRGNAEWDIAMTGFALLAFSSAGQTTEQGEYTATVDAGARFLMSRVTDYGRFETASGQYLYSHSIGTQALCELYAYSDNPVLGVYAQEVLDYLIYAQHEGTGGWRYEANQAGDTSVSGWAIMALNAGYKAGLEVAGFRDALRFLDSVTSAGYYEVGYMPGSRTSVRLDAIGALGRLFVDAKPRDARVLWAGRRALQKLPAAGQEDYYYWYYGSLVMFQLGGVFWEEWNEALKPALLSVQELQKRSPFIGSWPARGQYANNGGRVMQTSLAVLMLTTYYRYDRERETRIHTLTGDVAAMAAPYLEILLGDADPVTRDVTQAKLVDSFGVALASVVIRELRKEETSKDARKRLAALLNQIATGQHELVVLELLASEPDRDVRTHLWRTLEGVCSARSAESLARELENGDPAVRTLAARTLGRLGVADASVPLSARLAEEKVEGVRAELQKALGLLANPEPLIALVDSALDEDDSRRLGVIEGLSILSRDEMARELIAEAERDLKLHKRVLEAIREHGREAGVPVLMLALESDRKQMRELAIKLLKALTGTDNGFSAEGPADARRDSLRRWTLWWEKLIEDGAGGR